MVRKGLNLEEIMVAAMKLVEEKGYDNFSLRELAARLNVKPASLYNHVSGIEQINTEIAFRASAMLHDVLAEAIEGKESDQAFLDAVHAYRQFAMDNPAIYQALIKMPTSSDENIVHAALKSFAPLRRLIHEYHIGREETIHFVRALRSTMHGFVELTQSGFMQRGGVSRDETYDVMMKGFLQKLKEMSHREKVYTDD